MRMINTDFVRSPYFGVAAKTLIAMAMISAVWLGMSLNGGDVESAGKAALALLALSTLGLGALGLHFIARNAQSDQIVAAFVDGTTPSVQPFVLYLRPFVTDGRITIERHPVGAALAESLFAGVTQFTELEGVVLAAIGNRFSTIQIGRSRQCVWYWQPLEYLRTTLRSRIGTYYIAKWEPLFERLAHQARWCVLVPPHQLQAKTCYEVQYLVEHDLLSKTLFVMPQSFVRISGWHNGGLAAQTLWSNLAALIPREQALPRYVKSGGLVAMTANGFQLIRGIGGARWDTPAVFRKVFEGGVLNDSPRRDALRITTRLAITLPLWCTLAFVIARSQFSHSAPLLWAFGGVIAVGAGISFYRYCQNFLLTLAQYRALWATTLAGYVVSMMLSNRLLSPFDPLHYMPTLDTDVGQALVLFALLSALPAFVVFCIAYAVLSKRTTVQMRECREGAYFIERDRSFQNERDRC